MPEHQLKKWNTIIGWVVFLIAFVTYSLTVEPTASFWDCSEYITTSSKLQVGHPPGAPLFQMMGAFFSVFATEADQIAKMVNYVSVSSSALTIMLLFWIITNLLKKLAVKDGPITISKAVAIISGGLTGALALTFSDTFWFSAVEAEVYAMAVLFMALMFWLALKWIDETDSPRANRWLILIALVTGLSFGVHFMALLTIPAIFMLYFFKTRGKITIKSFILANALSAGVLLFIFKLMMPSALKFFGYMEVYFVNSIGLPFNSGTIIAALLLIGAFYLGLRYTRKKAYVNANTLILCTAFIFIGFSSWLMIPIRANSGVTINLFNPSDARQLLAYYNLEQYPENPLLHGPLYTDMFAGNDPDNPSKDDKPKYERDEENGKYIIVNKYKDALRAPHKDHMIFLPRMWSREHAENYMAFGGAPAIKIKPEYANQAELRSAINKMYFDVRNGNISEERYIGFIKEFREYIEVERPSLMQNLNYLFEYQIGYMYWRYFMWNFSGRQDDIQGEYNNHGNWLSGIDLIDSRRLGSQKNLPSDIRNNKARNTYYLLPLILGLFGFVFQLRKDPKRLWVLTSLFLFTGIALKLYLNERPFEPRERDYALVGSFYVFTIWIGIGAYMLINELQKLLSYRVMTPVLTGIGLLTVPTLMAYQNWDDHDRSNRYTAQAMARSFLDSIQENKGSILFTAGDNDTYALWYAQEVEGYRRDVKTVNSSSLLSADWHIDQVKRRSYESEGIPSQLTHKQYAWGVRDIIRYEELTDSIWSIKDFMNWVSSDDPKTKYGHLVKQFGGDPNELAESDQDMVYYPTNKIRIPVNKENVMKSGIVKEKDKHLIVDYIDIELPKSYLTKNRLLMLDILANNDWKRPLYFVGGTSDPAEYIWLKDYLQLDGLVYKLVPIKTPVAENSPFDLGRIDTELMYDTIMKWSWGNSGHPDVYHDPRTRVNGITYRNSMARLVEKLIEEGKNEKAVHIMDLAMEKMPIDQYGYYVFLEPYIEGYYQVGEKEKARNIYHKLTHKYREYLDYYADLDLEMQYSMGSDIVSKIEYYRNLLSIMAKYEEENFARKEIDLFNNYLEKFLHFYRRENQ
ncbi:DUF2723 domain-containing protein [Leptobacterium flavescens]|uniref:DUF2723 domain-containing protein n=1 Tax=Leptobacterium flavescens TaxID=472055 RepID=A0A6P0UH97_9FLAO|nr:DUF2723 domain-containing protein [Leptobacterium flavescens]NER12691.1 DUF2723 domain-containing protein [Leptobacterium flavescens]